MVFAVNAALECAVALFMFCVAAMPRAQRPSDTQTDTRSPSVWSTRGKDISVLGKRYVPLPLTAPNLGSADMHVLSYPILRFQVRLLCAQALFVNCMYSTLLLLHLTQVSHLGRQL